MTSTFKSSTKLRSYKTPLTADIDFLQAPEAGVRASQGAAPSSQGHAWPQALEPRELARDPGLDDFGEVRSHSFADTVQNSSRKYAASFTSSAKRMPPPEAHTPASLGPGAYDHMVTAVRVMDPKRPNYTFKSQTAGSLFNLHANQPPDTIQPIQSAILRRDWTAKGVAFSTRERFPRNRPKWKE